MMEASLRLKCDKPRSDPLRPALFWIRFVCRSMRSSQQRGQPMKVPGPRSPPLRLKSKRQRSHNAGSSGSSKPASGPRLTCSMPIWTLSRRAHGSSWRNAIGSSRHMRFWPRSGVSITSRSLCACRVTIRRFITRRSAMFGMDCEHPMDVERGIQSMLPRASRPTRQIACVIAANFVEIAAAVAQHLAPAGAGGGANAGILIRLDERALRAAGIGVEQVMRERGGADFALPGNVVIPPGQVHVVAAPAAGLVDALLVSADEPVKVGQPVATLRSPTIVEAQQQFLAAIADESLATDRLRRTQLLIEGKAIPERELNIAQAESARARARLDERTQLLSLMGLSDTQITELRTTRRIVPTVTIYSPINGTVVTRQTS